jgi:hypothetical protein
MSDEVGFKKTIKYTKDSELRNIEKCNYIKKLDINE